MTASIGRRLLAVAYRTLEIAGIVSISLIMVHTLANVVGRYFFDTALPNTNDIVAGWYMPLTIFIGIVFAKTRGEHIEAGLIYDRVSPKNQWAMSLISHVISAVVLVLFTILTAQEALRAFDVKETTVTGVVIYPVLVIVPFGFGVLAILFVVDAVQSVRQRFLKPSAAAAPALAKAVED